MQQKQENSIFIPQIFPFSSALPAYSHPEFVLVYRMCPQLKKTVVSGE